MMKSPNSEESSAEKKDISIIENIIERYKTQIINDIYAFKKSKTGMLGFFIVLFFVLMALLVPIMGLHDPINWRAPIIDRVEVQAYWDWPYVTDHPINTSIGYRIIPKAFDPRVDRVYAASGNVLHAVNPSYQHPVPVWKFFASSEITSSPMVINYGDIRDPYYANHIIYFGCEDGRLYALNDPVDNEIAPSGSLVKYIDLDGAIYSEIKIDGVYEGSEGKIEKSTIYVATDNKTLYAILPYELSYTTNDPIKWKIHFADALSSPAFLESEFVEDIIYIGTRNGELHALNASDGSERWVYSIGDQWSSSPIVVKSSPVVVHAASDDGKLYALYANNGTEKQGWEGGIMMRTLEIEHSEYLPDNGVLTTPTATGNGGEIYLGSSTGHVYDVRDDGSIKWKYKTRGITGHTTITSPPFYDRKFKKIFVGVADTQNTADSTDDIGILCAINNNGEIEWQQVLDGVIKSRAVVSMDENLNSTHLYPSVWVGTTEGKVYSYGAFGRYIAPLRPGTYSSGNTYVLGTDWQGRDVFSQLIWASQKYVFVGFSIILLSILIGTILGMIAGYYQKWVNFFIMLLANVSLGIPIFLFLLIVIPVSANYSSSLFVTPLFTWAIVARLISVEGSMMKEKIPTEELKEKGLNDFSILFYEILPQIYVRGISYIKFIAPISILTIAYLEFAGMGDPKAIGWGMMLYYVQHANALGYWWWILPPGICLTLLIFGLILIGQAFEGIANKRLEHLT